MTTLVEDQGLNGGVFQILPTKKKEEVVETEGMALIEAEELIEEIERY